MMQQQTRARRLAASGFTLIEILIVVAIIAILAGLLFPAFKAARERGNQVVCASNLHQIGLAVQLYRNDEKRYPASLVHLLSSETLLSQPASGATELPAATFPAADATGYLKTNDVLFCPDDDKEDEPRSSYGDISAAPQFGPDGGVDPAYYSRKLWNYWGYDTFGAAYATATAPTATDLLLDPAAPFHERRNPIMYSLSNRYAPAMTIVTHCVFHRTQTSQMGAPNEAVILEGARDIILRVDGSAKSAPIDVYSTSNWWQYQGKAH
jgi:prepilin-type N-terminal cleavage/methylation domain-containing protein